MGQGRPLHENFIGGTAWLVAQFAGLPTLYFVGYLVLCLNILLFSSLLFRLFPQPVFVGLGTLAFSLYPTDTTQAFLTHSLGLQPSLTFLLLGLHAYLSGWQLFAYPVVVIGCMVTYEPVFPLFLAAPILLKDPAKRHWIRHIALCLAMAGAIYAKRVQLDSSRLSEVKGSPLAASLKNLVVGPLVNLSTLVSRPFEFLFQATASQILAIVFLTLLFTFLTGILHRASREKVDKNPGILKFAISTLLLAYPIMLAVSASEVDGRNSRVHFAAIVGAVLLQTLALTEMFARARAPRSRRLLCLATGLYLSLLLAFGWSVQQDYIEQQVAQRDTWTAILTLVPDLETSTLIVVEHPLVATEGEPPQIKGFSWSSVTILDLMMRSPDDWKAPTVLFVRSFEKGLALDPETGEFLVFDAASLFGVADNGRTPPERTVLLQKTGSGSWRRLATWSRDGKTIKLKPVSDSPPKLEARDCLLKKLLLDPAKVSF